MGSFGLFILRLGFGGMVLWSHGLPKLLHFSEKASSFPDPLGIGHGFSLGLAIFAEFFCSILLIWGILTRLVAIPLLATMLTAIFLIHGNDPLGERELAILYAIPFFALIFTGPGKVSIDHFIFGKKTPAPTAPPTQIPEAQ